MRVAVDAMGGDFAPSAIVDGSIQALQRNKKLTKIYLVGERLAVDTVLRKYSIDKSRLEIVPTTEVVGMDESPAVAIRRKKDSSIGRAVDLVKEGKADAVFSAGNTGAAVAATKLKLRTLEGVERPAIATVIPTPVTPFILLDAGANTDCTPAMLAQFAVMGSVYSREILGQASPKIGLLSIGGEDAKGNEMTKETFGILNDSDLAFCGNVESKDLFEGRVDVVVCDGFVGNVVLKTSESVAGAIGKWIKQEFKKNIVHMLGALLFYKGIQRIKAKSDPAVHGGAPLLGIRGTCIIGHGASSALAVKNGIGVACESINHHINHLIVEGIEKIRRKSVP